MPKLLVLQHVAYEILGTLDPLLRSYGFRNRYVNFGRDPQAEPTMDGYHGLIVLGGPMNVDEVDRHPHLATELRIIECALEREVPILGICLGAQLVAKTLGAEVRRNDEKEIGWYDVATTIEAADDPLMRHFDGCEKLFQWHGDTFDVPGDAVHLATSTTCANQAFRYGERVYGFQFHLEVDEPMIGRWLEVPAMRDEIESLQGAVDPAHIRCETARHVARLQALADDTFSEFAGLFGAVRRRDPHPHR